MNHGEEAHTVYTVAFRSFRTKSKKYESTFTTYNIPHLHSSIEQNLSYNFETLHHARAVKSLTAVIFGDTKDIVLGMFNNPMMMICCIKLHCAMQSVSL